MHFFKRLADWFRSDSQSGEEATVQHVIDGDSVRLTDGREVRYIGVDAAELGSDGPWAKAAKDANIRLVQGKRVRLEREVSETDRYGRLLRHVYVGDRWVNGALVAAGLTRVRLYAPDVQRGPELVKLQEEAQRRRRGMWRTRVWWRFWERGAEATKE
ncbi:MAG: thermonuclease family protein [Caldilineaceae bacterium]|nr:thermonuclease family protein [Caldilineaceae bacterium]